MEAQRSPKSVITSDANPGPSDSNTLTLLPAVVCLARPESFTNQLLHILLISIHTETRLFPREPVPFGRALFKVVIGA